MLRGTLDKFRIYIHTSFGGFKNVTNKSAVMSVLSLPLQRVVAEIKPSSCLSAAICTVEASALSKLHDERFYIENHSKPFQSRLV